MRESKIESDIREYALSRGWLVFKTVTPGKRGFPDRIVLRQGRYVHIEVKRPLEEPTAQQSKRHREMRAQGAEVYVVDAVEQVYEILK